MTMMHRTILVALALGSAALGGQTVQQPDWSRVEEETMRHFQALLRFDTSDPPGREIEAAEYLRKVLEAELHRFVRFHYDVVKTLAGRN